MLIARAVGTVFFWMVGVLIGWQVMHIADRQPKTFGRNHLDRLKFLIAGLEFMGFFVIGWLNLVGLGWSSVSVWAGIIVLFLLLIAVGVVVLDTLITRAIEREASGEDQASKKLKIKPKRKHTPDDSGKRKSAGPEG
jgi:fatty acid desaturase